jgi:hypothetical protein
MEKVCLLYISTTLNFKQQLKPTPFWTNIPVKQAKNQRIGPQDWYSGCRASSYFVTSLMQQNLLPPEDFEFKSKQQ